MANLKSLDYPILQASGKNYLEWVKDTEIHLRSNGLAGCIDEEVESTDKKKNKCLQHMHHHIAESLKSQYLFIDNPLALWTQLKRRYGHQKTVLLPKAEFDWKNLRIQDYKSVEEYNSELFRIVSLLRLCGKEVTERELIEKTLSTFSPNNRVLQQQYRHQGFADYGALIECLLLAEQNDELLLINSAMRPPGTAPLPEANKVDLGKKTAIESKEPKVPHETNYVHRERHYGQGRGGRGRGGRGGQAGRGGRGRGGRGRMSFKPHTKAKSVCHRCGMSNRWSKTCRTPKHLIDAYQEVLKKNPEANYAYIDDEGDFDHENDDLLETSDCLHMDD
ncbi:PREDICTED: uncharacterized protein LOC104790005 [Camelina sativa]|uniref:Uncharacterized protein LOC104790005 n=1 Tax=Camelina sativa TaxID=90675 RepID=A0ABM0ZCX6_CAMSA|nr:PREDICTED: uncharacterized protein LOC104790005 [Camelina sativa]XP_010513992.1 PREDICTED: uncharacterized protein LOC104790005 [Camelina sativa]XP_010513993.1 PREDICTED: uncharacterized protein LOC104790005 [Camelina sativa]XP_010513994.1 PREDICTED: uncharacterized protein LOC104790005 [Camelina sativa]